MNVDNEWETKKDYNKSRSRGRMSERETFNNGIRMGNMYGWDT